MYKFLKSLTDVVGKMGEQDVIIYGISLPDGSLARLNHYGFHEDQWQLTSKKIDDSLGAENPLFLTEDKEIIGNTLFENVPEYNSEPDRPNWGKFKREDLTPVCIRLFAKCEPVDIKPIENVGPWIVDTRDSFRSMQDKTRIVWVLVSGTLEQWQSRVGQKLAFGSLYNQRLVLEVREAEEEWADLCENKQGVVFICERN